MPVLILIRKKEKNKRFFNNPMCRSFCFLEYLLTTIKAYKFCKFVHDKQRSYLNKLRLV